MKYLIKTNNASNLDATNYNRIIYDTFSDKIYCMGGVGLHNGYAYVDLGLPSGTMWAKYDIGSNNEYKHGDYYRWGESIPTTEAEIRNDRKDRFNWPYYSYSPDGTNANMTKYNATDQKTILDIEDDTAHNIMGGNWRMPTLDDYKELINNTDSYIFFTDRTELSITEYEETQELPADKTIKGFKVCNKTNHEIYITFPLSGRARFADIDSEDVYYVAWLANGTDDNTWYQAQLLYMTAKDGNIFYNDVHARCYGLMIRGILKP